MSKYYMCKYCHHRETFFYGLLLHVFSKHKEEKNITIFEVETTNSFEEIFTEIQVDIQIGIAHE